VSDGIVEVHLTEQVLRASAADRRLLGAQLAWTLGQLDGVKGVRVTAGSVPVPELGDLISEKQYPDLDPAAAPTVPAVAVVGKQVVSLGKTITPLPGALGDVRVPALVHPAISPNGGRAAALDASQTHLYVSSVKDGSALLTRLTATKITAAPSFDPSGAVWVAGQLKGSSAIWVVSGGAARRVVVPDLGPAQVVRALRIARDGVRAAIVIQRTQSNGKGRGELYLGRIQRTATETRLDGLHRVDSGRLDFLDVAWAGPDSMLVLTADTLTTYLVQPFGVVAPTGVGVLKLGKTVTAAPLEPVLGSTSNGQIRSVNSTDTWVSLPRVPSGTGHDPSYPG
jgi:hypothetical protein